MKPKNDKFNSELTYITHTLFNGIEGDTPVWHSKGQKPFVHLIQDVIKKQEDIERRLNLLLNFVGVCVILFFIGVIYLASLYFFDLYKKAGIQGQFQFLQGLLFLLVGTVIGAILQNRFRK